MVHLNVDLMRHSWWIRAEMTKTAGEEKKIPNPLNNGGKEKKKKEISENFPRGRMWKRDLNIIAQGAGLTKGTIALEVQCTPFVRIVTASWIFYLTEKEHFERDSTDLQTMVMWKLSPYDKLLVEMFMCGSGQNNLFKEIII